MTAAFCGRPSFTDHPEDLPYRNVTQEEARNQSGKHEEMPPAGLVPLEQKFPYMAALKARKLSGASPVFPQHSLQSTRRTLRRGAKPKLPFQRDKLAGGARLINIQAQNGQKRKISGIATIKTTICNGSPSFQ